jgi:hypothetical protein
MRVPGFTAEASVYPAPVGYNGSFTRKDRSRAASVTAQTITFPVDYDYWGRLASLMARCPAPYCAFDLASGHCHCRTDIAHVGGPI